MKIPGGHAILLHVAVPDELLRAAHRWVAEDPERRSTRGLAQAHLTIAFLGKDLDDKWHPAIDRAGERAKAWLRDEPAASLVLGWRAFGRNQDHLALLVEPTSKFLEMRRDVIGTVTAAGKSVREDFGSYRPHVTMAKSTVPGFKLPPKPGVGLFVKPIAIEVKKGSRASPPA